MARGARYLFRFGPGMQSPEVIRFATEFVGLRPPQAVRRDDTHIFVTTSGLVRHRRHTADIVSFPAIAASRKDWIRSAGNFSWIGASVPVNSATSDAARDFLRVVGVGAGSLAAGDSGSCVARGGTGGKRRSYSACSSRLNCSSQALFSSFISLAPLNPHHNQTPQHSYRTGRHAVMIATGTAGSVDVV